MTTTIHNNWMRMQSSIIMIRRGICMIIIIKIIVRMVMDWMEKIKMICLWMQVRGGICIWLIGMRVMLIKVLLINKQAKTSFSTRVWWTRGMVVEWGLKLPPMTKNNLHQARTKYYQQEKSTSNNNLSKIVNRKIISKIPN